MSEAEVTSKKPDQEIPGAEEGKSVSETDVQEECREKGGQGEVIVSIEEKPKEASKEQPVVTLEKQGTPVEIEAVKPVDMGGDEPKEQVAASESERGKAILEQLVGQELPRCFPHPHAGRFSAPVRQPLRHLSRILTARHSARGPCNSGTLLHSD